MRRNPDETTILLVVAGAAAVGLYYLSKSQSDTSGGNPALNALYNAATGKLTDAQITQIAAQAYQDTLNAGGSVADAQATATAVTQYAQNPANQPSYASAVLGPLVGPVAWQAAAGDPFAMIAAGG